MTTIAELRKSQEEQTERLRRALHNFHRLNSATLTPFARAFTDRKDMRILPTGGASATDGKGTIYMRVNPELGDEHKHDRDNCYKRNAKDQLLCEACQVHEEMLVPLFHEIAHNAYGSFEAMSEGDKKRALSNALNEARRAGMSPKRLDRIEKSFSKKPPATYVEAAGRISPYLHHINNVLEDARINTLTIKARPGMGVMFESRMVRLFTEGIDQHDGTKMMWRDQPKNGQIAVGLLLLGSGYNYAGWLSEEIERDLKDPELRDLVKRAVLSESTKDVYRLSFTILEKLRSMGYYAPEDAEPDDEDTGGDDDDSGDAEGDTEGEGESGDGEPQKGDGGGGGATKKDGPKDDEQEVDPGDDGGSGAEDGDASDDDEADGGSGGDGDDEADQDDDEADGGSGGDQDGESGQDDGGSSQRHGGGGAPEEVTSLLGAFCGHLDDDPEHEEHEETEPDPVIEKLIVQDRDFDEPSNNIYQVRVFRNGEPLPGHAGRSMGGFDKASVERFGMHVIPFPERMMQQSLGRLRVAFSENKKSKHQKNMKSGKINGAVLGRRVPTEDVRLFQKKKRPGKRDYLVVIGLDLSGSTYGQEIVQIKSAAMAQAELLHRVGVPFEVWGHTGNVAYGTRETELHMFEVKTAEQPWDKRAKELLESLSPEYMNIDGHTMEFYRKRLDRSRATDKLIMYYTDGSMPAENYNEELRILQRELKICKQRGYEVVGVGIGTDAPKAHGIDTVIINSIEDVTKVVKELGKRLA